MSRRDFLKHLGFHQTKSPLAMSNEVTITQTNEERIKADADKAYPIVNGWHTEIAANMGYIAGATAEHDRAQVLVDALEWIKNYGNDLTVKFIDKLLEQWKSGKGKDEQRETCGMCKERPVGDGLTVCNDCYENFDGDRRGFWESDVYQ